MTRLARIPKNSLNHKHNREPLVLVVLLQVGQKVCRDSRCLQQLFEGCTTSTVFKHHVAAKYIPRHIFIQLQLRRNSFPQLFLIVQFLWWCVPSCPCCSCCRSRGRRCGGRWWVRNISRCSWHRILIRFFGMGELCEGKNYSFVRYAQLLQYHVVIGHNRRTP